MNGQRCFELGQFEKMKSIIQIMESNLLEFKETVTEASILADDLDKSHERVNKLFDQHDMAIKEAHDYYAHRNEKEGNKALKVAQVTSMQLRQIYCRKEEEA